MSREIEDTLELDDLNDGSLLQEEIQRRKRAIQNDIDDLEALTGGSIVRSSGRFVDRPSVTVGPISWVRSLPREDSPSKEPVLFRVIMSEGEDSLVDIQADLMVVSGDGGLFLYDDDDSSNPVFVAVHGTWKSCRRMKPIDTTTRFP